MLQDIDLEINPGDKLGLVGLNGSGKSSLLRLLGGILEPTRGSVVRRPGATTSLLALGVGFSGDLVGSDNAIMSAVIQGARKAEAVALLPLIREFSELGDAFDEPVRTYSSGMRSRLAFSVAMFIDVDILLIDEVLAVGDGHFRQKAKERLKEKMSGDQTVVLVSHDLGQVAEICTTAAWLKNGKIEASGAVDSILSSFSADLKKPGRR